MESFILRVHPAFLSLISAPVFDQAGGFIISSKHAMLNTALERSLLGTHDDSAAGFHSNAGEQVFGKCASFLLVKFRFLSFFFLS